MGDILFLAHRVPFPPTRGDKIRSHHLLRKLAQCGDVHVGCFADSEEDRAAITDLAKVAASHCVVDRKKPLIFAGIEAVLCGKPVSLTAFHSARLESWVRHVLREKPVETVVIFSGQMGQYLPDDYAGRFIIDFCDVDSAKFEDYAEAGDRVWLNTREGRLLSQEEEQLSNRADTTILISEAEANLFKARLGGASNANVHVIGNGIDAAFFDAANVTPHPAFDRDFAPHFVFTGQMDYRPNEQAALWAIEQFLPVIRSQNPLVQFHVVGRNPTPALLKHSNTQSVHIWGEVPDVRPFIAAADCVLAPLLIARGVQNKVLEAMAMAKPVLLTPQAATGISATDGKHWMVCESDPELMANKFAGEKDMSLMGQSARQYVLDHHDWAATLAPLETMIGKKSLVRDAA